MQKVIALPLSGDIFYAFSREAILKTELPVPPEDILLAGSWENDGAAGFSSSFRRLVPATVFCKEHGILCSRQPDGALRIWFGEPVTQEEFSDCHTLRGLVTRTIKKERVRRDIPYAHIGYCTQRNGHVYPDFLILYAVKVRKKQLLSNELWADIAKIQDFYFRLEPLSKKIFDLFYETPALHTQYLV